MPVFIFVAALSGEELWRHESPWGVTLAELHTYFADVREDWRSTLCWGGHVSRTGGDLQVHARNSSPVLEADATIGVVKPGLAA